ncbi:MAG: hypothetical protein JWN43_464 [Gammaproteobacteria bacterium]|nr:hypothetical protein [Gammaproteobacteria bacterium]
MQPNRLRYAAWALSVGWLSGCAALGGGQSKPKIAAPPPERPQPEASSITPVLELMRTLPAGDPARQAELFQAAKDAAALSPTTSNKLKYALALATPGHGGSDPVAAQRQLAELLATPETLLPIERLLALVELQDVDQRLILQEENKQLREEAPRESRDKLLAINRRLAAESDENARLRKALDEAQAKLEAVTHIERSIIDRGTNGSHTP